MGFHKKLEDKMATWKQIKDFIMDFICGDMAKAGENPFIRKRESLPIDKLSPEQLDEQLDAIMDIVISVADEKENTGETPVNNNFLEGEKV
jgi:hypothetical protein